MLNKRLPEDRATLEVGAFERRAVELADVVISPSEYMLAYLAQRGWILPRQRYVIPNLVQSEMPSSASSAVYSAQIAIAEFVFFGRIEERKGIRLFLKLSKLLCDEES